MYEPVRQRSCYRFLRHGWSAAMGMGLCVSLAGPVLADDTNNQAQPGELQPVIVTAQRRAENVQNVPISLHVVSSKFLQGQNYNSLDSLTQITPGLLVQDAGASSNLYIRGIGSAGIASFDQSVGEFEDDIYYGRARMSLAPLFDLDRIEVLKGPQSTFFGNNAIAGALNIITKKPGKFFDASARVLYGMFGTYAAEGAVTLPITGELSTRLAVIDDGGEGWIHDTYTGDHSPRTRNQGVRLTTSFKRSGNFDATLKIEGTRHMVLGSPVNEPLQITRCPPPAPYVASGFCALALQQGVPTYAMGDIGGENSATPGQGNWFSMFENELTMNYRLGRNTLTSVTGFYNYHFSEKFNINQTPVNLLSEYVAEKYHQFSQELRIASDMDRSVQYLGGVYFQTDQLDPNPSSLNTNFSFLSPALSGIPPLAPYLPLGESQNFWQGEHVYSIFGSLKWAVTRRLMLDAGVRGSDVRKSARLVDFYGTLADSYGANIAPLPPPLAPIPSAILGALPPLETGHRTDHAWMPSADIQYKLDPAVMAYFSYSRGFKAGGFNSSDTTGNAASIPFKPEHVNAYELGVKSDFLDNRARLNVDLFRSDYSDLQSPVTYLAASGVYVSVVRNAGSSRTQGVELETQWLATKNLRFAASASYIDAYYLSYTDGPPATTQLWAGQQFRDQSGMPIGATPPWTASVAAEFDLPLAGGDLIAAKLMPFFSSHYDISNDPLQHEPGYVRLDAALSLTSSDGRWEWQLIGKNLTDREIYTTIVGTSLATGTLYVGREEPRNVAVQLNYRY